MPGALSLGIKRPSREADHSPPSSVEVKEWLELYIHSPSTTSWRGAQLKKHKDNYTFTLQYLQYVQDLLSVQALQSRLCRTVPP
jgi:hypothetical protein